MSSNSSLNSICLSSPSIQSISDIMNELIAERNTQQQQSQQHQRRGIKRKSIESIEQNDFQCQICCSVFANSANLRQHIDTLHLKNNIWTCTQCDKKFTSKSNLKVHLRVHTRVRPYHCKHCKYNCMHHSSIKEHLIKIHPEVHHSTNNPGYIYNSNAVPEPEEFNSQSFNKDAFIAEAKETNEKLSEQIASTITTPIYSTPSSLASSISSSSNAESFLSTPEIKRQKIMQQNRKEKQQQLKHAIHSTPIVATKNPFSIDYIINTPTTPKTASSLVSPSSFNQQNFYLNAWLQYATNVNMQAMFSFQNN